jgi:hypothetical protein
MSSHPRTKRRPLPTTPALLALVNRVQDMIDKQGLNYTLLADLTGYSRMQVKNLVEGRILSPAGYKALDTALGADGTLMRMRARAIAERDAIRHGYQVDEPAGEAFVVAATDVTVPLTSGSGDGSSPSAPREVSPSNRRDLFALLGAGTALGAVPVLTPADRLILLEGTSRADSILSVVDAQIAGCANAYRTTAPATLIGRIDSVQRFIDGIGANLTLRPADNARLWRAATITAGLRGWVHNNAGDIDAARVSLAEAHKRADLLDDDRLISWTRYMQAIVEDYAGDPRTAQYYAEDGLCHAHAGPQRALLLSDAVAGARATLGDVNGVDTAVNEALDIAYGLTPEEQGSIFPASIINNIDSYHPASAATVATLAYARLGMPERVQRTVAVVRPTIEAEGTHHRPYVLMDEALAVSRSRDRDPERIASLTEEGLSLALPFQAAHVGKRAGAILDAVAPMKGHPAIRELGDTTRVWREQQRTPTA